MVCDKQNKTGSIAVKNVVARLHKPMKVLDELEDFFIPPTFLCLSCEFKVLTSYLVLSSHMYIMKWLV